MNRRPAEILVLCLLGLAPLAATAGSGRAPAAAAPSPELLEFLGSWETPEGQWVDPISFLGEEEDGVADDSSAGGSQAADRLPGRAPPDSRVKKHDEIHR